ncbi:hypothetical protein G7Y89_g10533 [Cudoniella acicularis]|uniref:Uncharacterized protein n=1 Tax=Cudoniella acicularis TaxID=354080 RepID=A0A8H4RCK8_9HELO|nr:hypothetical protein G7Y89_g10533 [Cudoniella acicularis]
MSQQANFALDLQDSRDIVSRATTPVARELAALPRQRDLALVVAKKIRSTPVGSDRPSYNEAALTYIVGDLQVQKCDSCSKGNGRFPNCIVAFKASGEAFFRGGCANCRYGDHPEKCSFFGKNPMKQSGDNRAGDNGHDKEKSDDNENEEKKESDEKDDEEVNEEEEREGEKGDGDGEWMPIGGDAGMYGPAAGKNFYVRGKTAYWVGGSGRGKSSWLVRNSNNSPPTFIIARISLDRGLNFEDPVSFALGGPILGMLVDERVS